MPCTLANGRCDNKVKGHWLSRYDLCSVTLSNMERSLGSMMTFHSFSASHTSLWEANANPRNARAATTHLSSHSLSVQSSSEDNQEGLI